MRIALGVEYDGHDYYGWQAQEGLNTVQGQLESALEKIICEPVKIFCAGRTDAGVHATHQVIHFDTNVVRDMRAFTIGVNTHLPDSIAVRWAKIVDDTFHARFSASSRTYRYLIFNSNMRTAILAKRATWSYYPLDAERMHAAGQALLGENDFTSFRSSQCESKTPMRNVMKLNVTRQHDFVMIEIQANAFLHHMVRNIAGVLMRIGSGLEQVDWAEKVLAARDRRAAAETAAPNGLYLTGVGYPDQFTIPTSAPTLLLL